MSPGELDPPAVSNTDDDSLQARHKKRFVWWSCKNVDIIEQPSEIELANQRIEALEATVRSLKAKTREQEQLLALAPEQVQWTWDMFVVTKSDNGANTSSGTMGRSSTAENAGRWVPVADYIGHYRHDLDELLTESYAGRDPLVLPSTKEGGEKVVYRADWLQMALVATMTPNLMAKEEGSGGEMDPWAEALRAGLAKPNTSETSFKLRRTVVKYKCPATNGLGMGVWSGPPIQIRKGVFYREIKAVDSANLADNSHFRIACHHFTNGMQKEALSPDDESVRVTQVDFLSNMDTQQRYKKFKRELLERGVSTHEQFVFHGSDATSIASIVLDGFEVGGGTASIANGSYPVVQANGKEFGRGVYTSSTVATALACTRRGGQLLLAVGLKGEDGVDSFAPKSTVRVFKRPEQLLPMYRIHFTRTAKAEAAALDRGRHELEKEKTRPLRPQTRKPP